MSNPTAPLLQLHTGNSIPALGYGCAEFNGPAGPEPDAYENKLRVAYDKGYRLFDCAFAYGTEDKVGNFAKPLRSEVYLVTKYREYTPGDTVDSVLPKLRECVRRMCPGEERPYVDLFLIHQPTMGEEGRRVLWGALVELQKLGETRDIGVSNFGLKHLLTLPAPKPVVNQVELHPWCQHRPMVQYCKEQGIIMQAYAPNLRNRKSDDPVLLRIAEELQKSPTQVLLRWSVQNGWFFRLGNVSHIPVPATNNSDRMLENISVFDFELSDRQMEDLNELGADGDHPVCKTYDDFCD